MVWEVFSTVGSRPTYSLVQRKRMLGHLFHCFSYFELILVTAKINWSFTFLLTILAYFIQIGTVNH